MSVGGLCQICEVREAEFSCDNCGAVVCEDHYDEARGLCADCARVARGGGERPEGTEDVADGQDDVARGAEDGMDQESG